MKIHFILIENILTVTALGGQLLFKEFNEK